jgi:phosphopantetheinyl transferase
MTSTLHSPPPAALLDGVTASTRRARRWDEPPAWLSADERARAARIRHRTARDAWLTARLAAKRLVAARLTDPVAGPQADRLGAIEIRSRDAAGRGSRPRVEIAGREAAIALSIAHADGRVLVAVGPAARPLGVDLTPATAFAGASSCWWLTAAERDDVCRVGSAAATTLARLWSVKEAVYKAVLNAEPFRPQAIEVRIGAGRIVSCRAAGRSLSVAGIRSWPVAGHWLAIVQAPVSPCAAEA